MANGVQHARKVPSATGRAYDHPTAVVTDDSMAGGPRIASIGDGPPSTCKVVPGAPRTRHPRVLQHRGYATHKLPLSRTANDAIKVARVSVSADDALTIVTIHGRTGDFIRFDLVSDSPPSVAKVAPAPPQHVTSASMGHRPVSDGADEAFRARPISDDPVLFTDISVNEGAKHDQNMQK